MTTSPTSLSSVAANWEYLKTLISVFAGFITAFLAEPIKVYFTNKAKRNNFRRSLYGEILGIYESFFTLLVSAEERGVQISFSKVVSANLDCYKFAKSDPVTFYQLKESSLINQVYKNIELLRQENESGIEFEKSLAVAKLIILQIESFLISQKIDRKIMVEYSTDLSIKNRVKNLFSGKLHAGELTSSSPKNKSSR